jgi:hypothetical protein
MRDLKGKFYLGAAFAQIPILSAFLQWNSIILALFDNHPVVRLANTCMEEGCNDFGDRLAIALTFMGLCYQARNRSKAGIDGEIHIQ